MYIQFNYKNGSNPYVTTNNKGLFRMITKYYVNQTSENTFDIEGKLQLLTIKPLKSKYERNKAILEGFAREWQYNFSDFNYSYGELIAWQGFFTEYGKKYGLLKEFKENCIC